MITVFICVCIFKDEKPNTRNRLVPAYSINAGVSVMLRGSTAAVV